MKKTYFMPTYDGMTETLFKGRGYTLVTDPKDSAFAVFTGGADVCPFLYGERALDVTQMDMGRDKKENKFFRSYSKPKVGICRGGQFLNVMSGGSMWQDVNNHGVNHKVTLSNGVGEFDATSTHHQMMIPSAAGLLIGWADRCNRFMSDDLVHNGQLGKDAEIIMYEATNCLCFQPHPEYRPKSDMADCFFILLEDSLLT